MRPSICALVICPAIALAGVGRHTAGKSSAVTRAARLAAESLCTSAMELANAPSETPARAARLVALTRFAIRLDPTNARAHWLLAGIHEIQGNDVQAAKSLKVCLEQNGLDHVLCRRWLAAELRALDNADQRTELLKSVIDNEALPAPLRAQAAVHWADLLDRQGLRDAELETLRRAMTLDAGHPALRRILNLQADAAPVERVKVLLGQLRGNPAAANLVDPNDPSPAWQLAVVLNSLGLQRESVEMFAHAWSLFSRAGGDAKASQVFNVQYFNAMLDAGMAKEAIERFTPMPPRLARSIDLLSLMLEAYRATGEKEKADEIIQAIERRNKIAESTSQDPAAVSAQIAWFYLVTKPQPDRAIIHAEKLPIDNPTYQRILGVAELATGKVEQGRERLEKLAATDPYAAAALAEHYFELNDKKRARDAIAAGSAATRGGPAFRKLLAVAAVNKVEIPPAKGADEVRNILKAFDRRYLEMGLHPENFLAVKISAPSSVVRVGEPVVIEATLINRGPLPAPIGAWGLASPAMSLQVEASSGAEKASFVDLPLVLWPAPRYLSPGKSVTRAALLNAGALGRHLTERPLENVRLTVSGMLDPIQRGKTFRSALPDVKIEPLVLTRVGLLGGAGGASPADPPKAYRLALGRIVRDIARGPLPARMAAARKIAALLAMFDRLTARRARLAKELAKVVSKPVALAMLRAALNDRSPVVRAEMLAALGRVKIDESILMLLGGAIGDADPLVRFRAAELIGASNTPDKQTVLDHLAGDPDELVALMARALRSKTVSEKPKSGRMK